MTTEVLEELTQALAAGLPERVSSEVLTRAVENASDLIALLRGQKYKRVQGIGDDFCPRTDRYNTVGAIYSLLSRDKKEEALAAFLHQLDVVNYFYVQENHTPFIREPLLLADISIARPPYWPGLDEGQCLTKEHPNFEDFSREFMGSDGLFDPKKVKSDFCVAYAALRADTSQFGADYARAAHPRFLERVVAGIVALRFGRAITEKDIEQGHARLRELLPQGIHRLVDKKSNERGWVDAAKFSIL